MLTGELVERHQPFPIIRQPFDCLGSQLPIASGELCPESFTGGLGLGIRHRTQQSTRLGLMSLG